MPKLIAVEAAARTTQKANIISPIQGRFETSSPTREVHSRVKDDTIKRSETRKRRKQHLHSGSVPITVESISEVCFSRWLYVSSATVGFVVFLFCVLVLHVIPFVVCSLYMYDCVSALNLVMP